jgi:hypothetical protein
VVFIDMAIAVVVGATVVGAAVVVVATAVVVGAAVVVAATLVVVDGAELVVAADLLLLPHAAASATRTAMPTVRLMIVDAVMVSRFT